MSLETHSTKRNRVYQRAFDHDEARRLRENGWTFEKLAEHFGVSITSVAMLFNNRLRERMREQSLQWARREYLRPCIRGCGRNAWHQPGRRGICVDCAAEERTSTVRPDSLLCTRCNKWKPDEDFFMSRGNKRRRQRHSICRPCSTEARREWRQRNPEKEREATRRSNQRRAEKRGQQMTQFVVLKPNGNGYEEVVRVDAVSAVGAVEKAATAAGDYIAVPESRMRPMRVEPVQKFSVVSRNGDDA